MRRLIPLLLCVALSACSLPLAIRPPAPAENTQVKVLIAGYAVHAIVGSTQEPTVIWGFVFRSKQPTERYEHVRVEELRPNGSAVTLVDDTAPTLMNGKWYGKATPIPADPASVPWLFTSGASRFIFRFTIKPVGAPAFVLNQPTVFTSASKQAQRDMLRQLHRK